jgi:hypothetical protein
MWTSGSRRMCAALGAALAVLALAAPSAPAVVTGDLSIGAELLDQPANQPWSVNLLLGVKLTDSTGQENLPVTERIFLEFPKAKVNGDKFPKCTASDGALTARGPSACPRDSLIGSGVAHVRGIALPFTADIKLFNGRGTNRDREIVIYAKERSLEVVVILRGKLRQISRGDFGFEFDLTIPPNAIQLLSDQFVAIEDFEVKVGKRIRRNGRLISYIDAPRRCVGDGWPFTFRNELRGGAVVTDRKRISCIIKAR